MDLAPGRQSSRTLLWKPVRLTFSSPRGLREIRILALTGCTLNVTCPRTQSVSGNLIEAWVRPTCSVGSEQGNLLLLSNGCVLGRSNLRVNLPEAAARGQVSCPGLPLGLLLHLVPLETWLIFRSWKASKLLKAIQVLVGIMRNEIKIERTWIFFFFFF